MIGLYKILEGMTPNYLLVEDCKKALDKHMHVGLLLLDLSKAFDCLPHKLLLCKLHAYGVSRDACGLFCSYLTNRTKESKYLLSRVTGLN